MWASFVRSLALGSILRKVQYPIGMQTYFIPVYHYYYYFTISLFSCVHLLIVFVFIPDCSITKFLNRILGLEVHKQNDLFQYFTDNFDYLIEKDKKEGKYDMGILGMEVKCYSKHGMVFT